MGCPRISPWRSSQSSRDSCPCCRDSDCHPAQALTTRAITTHVWTREFANTAVMDHTLATALTARRDRCAPEEWTHATHTHAWDRDLACPTDSLTTAQEEWTHVTLTHV